jgi:uncharacterized protein (TIGR02996 family)
MHDSFFRAILDEAEDDTPRLVFADWLEEHGQEARATWIRVSCQRAHVHYNDPTFGDLVLRERECFQRCRPHWWEEITGVAQWNDRGVYRFDVRSKTAAIRLGKVRWLGDAVAGGWLEGIRIQGYAEMAEVMTGWKETARAVPLFVELLPQIGDQTLAFYLGVPHLWGLDLYSHTMRERTVLRLGRRSDLRELTLKGMPARGRSRTVLEQVGQLTGLLRLTIEGHKRPTDDDLGLLSGLTCLRELLLFRCVGLTDNCVSQIAALSGLRRLKLWGCQGVSDAGVAMLSRALPAAQIERL